MRAYRWLLHLYPSSFRSEYGADMCADFAARRRQANCVVAVAALWLSEAADALVNGPRVHWDILRQDLRGTIRSLRRTPGFALAAIAVSSLGIGATTAAFSLADHVLVRPLPFPDPDRLVRLFQDQSYRGYPRLELSPLNYRDWERMNTTLDSMAAFGSVSVSLVGDGPPERVEGARVTASLLRTLAHPRACC